MANLFLFGFLLFAFFYDNVIAIRWMYQPTIKNVGKYNIANKENT